MTSKRQNGDANPSETGSVDRRQISETILQHSRDDQLVYWEEKRSVEVESDG